MRIDRSVCEAESRLSRRVSLFAVMIGMIHQIIKEFTQQTTNAILSFRFHMISRCRFRTRCRYHWKSRHYMRPGDE